MTGYQTAYNEFIADFVERHGQNQATRDEAHEWADRIVGMVREVRRLCGKYATDPLAADDATIDLVNAFIDSMEIDNKEEARFLARCVK